MIESEFRSALETAGLPTKEQIIADGRLHRFHVEGDKRGSRNGWYVLYDDGVPAGCFGSWKTGDKGKWCAKSDCELTPAQRQENKRRMSEARAARETEEQARREAARNKALSIWKAAKPAPDKHPYLVKKGVRNHGLRLHMGALVIPLRDTAGVIHSLQFIDDEGQKLFLSAGRKKACYFAIGKPENSLCIAEGYATAASIYEATGLAVAVAFDAGNLDAVAQALRAKFPQTKIILCADNDTETEGNPGLTKAREAAQKIGGFVCTAEVAHA